MGWMKFPSALGPRHSALLRIRISNLKFQSSDGLPRYSVKPDPRVVEDDLVLIARAQGGDVAARNALVERHFGYIVMMVKRGAGRHAKRTEAGGGLDELLSFGVEAFMRSIERFDARQGVKLTTYAGMGILRMVWREVNRRGVIRVPDRMGAGVDTAKRERARRMVHAGVRMGNGSGGVCGGMTGEEDEPWREAVRREERVELWERIERLEPRLRFVAKMRMQGLTCQDIADISRVCRTTVQSEWQRAMERLRGEGRGLGNRD